VYFQKRLAVATQTSLPAKTEAKFLSADRANLAWLAPS
jgi:hypothetical protein